MTALVNRREYLDVFQKLFKYCRENNWAGHDPYDALNSRLIGMIPILDHRVPRLVLTQLLKRSPIDLRQILLIPKTHNAKAQALFLSSLAQFSPIENYSSIISELISRIIDLRSPGTSYWSWGYSFPWQTRTIIVPTRTPNLVCTVFVGNALLDAYELNADSRCLEMAKSAVDYLDNELYWQESDSIAGFCYPLPERRSNIHNANLLGAALICRLNKFVPNGNQVEHALKVVRYSVSKQLSDGSWFYGEEPKSRWIDNFHTGYNLCALKTIGFDLQTTEFEQAVARGYAFYRNHFFRDDGAPRYFHNETYPIDIHCVAQSVITLLAFKGEDEMKLADKVLRWTLENMWDDEGYFYYRVLRSLTIKTSYMRWSQAWMLKALAARLSVDGNQTELAGTKSVAVV